MRQIRDEDDVPLINVISPRLGRQVRFAERPIVSVIPRSISHEESDDDWEGDAVRPGPSHSVAVNLQDLDQDPISDVAPPSYNAHLISHENPPPSYQSIYDSLKLQQDGKRVLHVYFVTLMFIGLYLFVMSKGMLQWNANLNASEFHLQPADGSNPFFQRVGEDDWHTRPGHSGFAIPMTLTFDIENLYAANFTPISVMANLYKAPYEVGQGEALPVPNERTAIDSKQTATVSVPVWLELGNEATDPGFLFLRAVLHQCHRQDGDVKLLVWYRVRGIVDSESTSVGLSEMKAVAMEQCWIPPTLAHPVLAQVMREEGIDTSQLASDKVTLGGIRIM
jgi:hypothetical protein